MRLLLASCIAAVTVAVTAGPAAASPAATPERGFGMLDCGGDVGIVAIPGAGSGTGFTADGRLFRLLPPTQSHRADAFCTLGEDAFPLRRVR